MLNEPYSVRSISTGEEARRVRVLVFDQDFNPRPLLKGESIGENPSQRVFQEVYAGDYVIKTSLVDYTTVPLVAITRHKEKPMSGTFGVEVLNRIHPVLYRYLMDYGLTSTRA